MQADVVVCGNGGAKVYKLLYKIEIIAVSRDLEPHTRHVPTRRQHIFRLAYASRFPDSSRISWGLPISGQDTAELLVILKTSVVN